MIDVKTEDGIATVTMRHGKANALDITLCGGLADCFDKLCASDARAVVLTGQGQIFSAGVDLLQVNAGGADYIRRFLPMLHRMYQAVFFHPKPLVAAVNGHAIAGGCVLACCADRRIMARGGGRMGITELLVGVPFPALAFEIVRFAGKPTSGVMKDVVVVPAWKEVEIDVRADQPGLSLFHCHQQFHMDMGFMTLVKYR